MKKSRFIAAAAGAAMVVAVAAPGVQAADTVTVTFEVPDGGLSLAIANKGSTFPVSGTVTKTASGALGDVTVTDDRASLAGWTVTATMDGPFQAIDPITEAPVDLDGDQSTSDDVIPCNAATVSAGALGVTTGSIGLVTMNPGGVLPLASDGEGGCEGDVASAVTTGSNTATFPTSISVAIPTDALAGTYQGVVTQTAG